LFLDIPPVTAIVPQGLSWWWLGTEQLVVVVVVVVSDLTCVVVVGWVGVSWPWFRLVFVFCLVRIAVVAAAVAVVV